jgi:hypothetical protein
MNTFANNHPLFRQQLAELVRQYVRRPLAPDPPAPAIEEPEQTDSRMDPVVRLLTAEEVQELTSIKKTWWLAEARADRIPHIRAGKYVRFEYPTVVQFLRERSATLREQR